jgi:hypothetical protein
MHSSAEDSGKGDVGPDVGPDVGVPAEVGGAGAAASETATTVPDRPVRVVSEPTALLVGAWGLGAGVIGAILGLAFGWVVLSMLLTVAGIAAFAAALRWYGVRQGAQAKITGVLLGAPVAAAVVALASGVSVGREWASAPPPAQSLPGPLPTAADTPFATSLATPSTTLPTSTEGGPSDRWPALINTEARSTTAYGITLVVQKIGNEDCGTAIPCGYITMTISNASSGVFEFGMYEQYQFYVTDGAGNPHVWNDWRYANSCADKFTVDPGSVQVPVKLCFQEPLDIGSKPLSAGFSIQGRQYAVNAIPGVTPTQTTTPTPTPTTPTPTTPAPTPTETGTAAPATTASGATSAQG